MVAPSLQGASSRQREGGPPGEGVVPAAGAAPVLLCLSLVAVVGVLQGVLRSSPGPVGLQAGAQALQAGPRGHHCSFSSSEV